MSQSETKESLVICGRGNVGTSLYAAAKRCNIPARLSPGRADLAENPSCSSLLLAVPGPAVEATCSRIVASGARPRLMAHLDGALGLGPLSSAGDAGISIAAIHPLQTFPSGDTPISGIPCAVTSPDTAKPLAFELAASLGMEPFLLPDEGRTLYHAAASIASNFLVTLEESAAGLMAAAGVEDPRSALGPLVMRTAENWTTHGANALTGPIARGEEETVERHRGAIQQTDPDLVATYDALAEQTRRLSVGGSAP